MKERLITRGQDATKSARFCAQNMAVHLPRGRDASASEAEQELEGDAAEVFIPRIVTGARLSCPYHPECTRVFRNPKTRQDYVRVHHDGRVRRERSTAGMGHSSCGRTDAQRERERCQRQQARAVLKDIVFDDLRGVSLSTHNLLCACLCVGQFIVNGVVEPDNWLLVLCRQELPGEEEYDYAATHAHIFRHISHLPVRNVVGLVQVATATRSDARDTPMTFVTARKFYAFLQPEPYFDVPSVASPWPVTKGLIKAVKKECTRLSLRRVLSECGKVDRARAAIMLGQIWEQTRAYPQVGQDDSELRAHTWAPSMLAPVTAGTT